MMKIIDYSDYKAYIRDLISSLPKRVRGQYLKLAGLLNVHSSMISYIFKGESELSIEQAVLVAEEYNLSTLEKDYFMTMVQKSRAGTVKARQYFDEQLKEKKKRFLNLQERVLNTTVLSEKDQAIFYSQWYFAAIHILTAVGGFDHPKIISEMLGIDIAKVIDALDFMARTGLCTFDGSRYSYGITKTYVGRDSHFVGRHHSNWRLKAMQGYDRLTHDELAYTCPTAISPEDFKKIREEIARLIEKFNQIVDPSPAEELVCLNIDWFKVKK